MHFTRPHANDGGCWWHILQYCERSCEQPCCVLVLCSGFTGDFWRAYHEVIPKAPGFDRRKDLYLLYHYLNHTNLFGGEAVG